MTLRKKIIVFAPHPDDEVLGCGGTIVKKLKDGYDVFIIFMTDGRYALKDIGVDKNPSPSKIKVIRRKEAIRAAEILGIPRINLFFLDIEDKSLGKHKKYSLEKITKMIKEIRPTEIFFPQELEYNPDHRATNRIIKEALKKLDFHIAEYRYSIAWRFPFYLLLYGLNEDRFYRLMCRFLRRNLLYIDISEFLSIKRRAIKQYASQLKIYSSSQKSSAIRPRTLRISLRNMEAFFI